MSKLIGKRISFALLLLLKTKILKETNQKKSSYWTNVLSNYLYKKNNNYEINEKPKRISKTVFDFFGLEGRFNGTIIESARTLTIKSLYTFSGINRDDLSSISLESKGFFFVEDELISHNS